VIPESEWPFFEAVERRIEHLARHRMENEAALYAGLPLPWDPAELCVRQAGVVQEGDFPARLEAAFGMEPTEEEARRLELLHRWVLATLFETHPDIAPLAQELRERHLAFCPQIRGRDVTRAEIRRIVLSEPDGDLRRDAWTSMVPFGETIEETAAELLRRREALARAVAGSGFPEIAFHIIDQERAEAVGLLDAVERFTRGTYQEAKREIRAVLGVQEVEPWDVDYGLMRLSPLPPDAFEAVPALDAARAQARRWGFGLDDAGVRWEACDLPFDALVLPLRIPGEIHILHAPFVGYDGLAAAFNATGRALGGLRARSRSPLLDRESPVMIEAAGALFEAVTRAPQWLAGITGAPPPAVRTHLRAVRFARVIALRRRAAVSAFENLAYAASNLKPRRLHSDVLEQMLEETRRPEALWPSDPFWVGRPLHHASAILGSLVAAQIGERLEAEYPEAWTREEAGAWLREEVFTPGAREDWRVTVDRAAGASLGIDALARELDLSVKSAALADVDDLSDAAVAEYFKDIDLSDIDRD
jgi:peptidyl-dipeptidase A